MFCDEASLPTQTYLIDLQTAITIHFDLCVLRDKLY